MRCDALMPRPPRASAASRWDCDSAPNLPSPANFIGIRAAFLTSLHLGALVAHLFVLRPVPLTHDGLTRPDIVAAVCRRQLRCDIAASMARTWLVALVTMDPLLRWRLSTRIPCRPSLMHLDWPVSIWLAMPPARLTTLVTPLIRSSSLRFMLGGAASSWLHDLPSLARHSHASPVHGIHRGLMLRFGGMDRSALASTLAEFRAPRALAFLSLLLAAAASALDLANFAGAFWLAWAPISHTRPLACVFRAPRLHRHRSRPWLAAPAHHPSSKFPSLVAIRPHITLTLPILDHIGAAHVAHPQSRPHTSPILSAQPTAPGSALAPAIPHDSALPLLPETQRRTIQSRRHPRPARALRLPRRSAKQQLHTAAAAPSTSSNPPPRPPHPRRHRASTRDPTSRLLPPAPSSIRASHPTTTAPHPLPHRRPHQLSRSLHHRPRNHHHSRTRKAPLSIPPPRRLSMPTLRLPQLLRP